MLATIDELVHDRSYRRTQWLRRGSSILGFWCKERARRQIRAALPFRNVFAQLFQFVLESSAEHVDVIRCAIVNTPNKDR